MINDILFVDGRPEHRIECTGVLERAGYRVHRACGARDAIEDARRDPPEAIVVAESGGGGALSAVRALRLHPATARVPILVLAPDVHRVHDAVEQLRSVVLLQAPASPRRLLEELRYATSLERRRQRGRPERAIVSPGNAAAARHAATGSEWRDERMRRTWGPLR